MKRVFCILVSFALVFSLTACKTDDIIIEDNYQVAECSKEFVPQFMDIIMDSEFAGIYEGSELKEENCYNVTSEFVEKKTGVKIFKFSDTCLSLALIDGKAYPLCDYFGGLGFINAVPWDYDADGNFDLLIASSSGSGMHRSQISVFDTKTKESIVVYNTIKTNNPCVDLCINYVPPTISSVNPNELPNDYIIYSVDINIIENNLASLKYSATDVVGKVVALDGKPVFIESEMS